MLRKTLWPAAAFLPFMVYLAVGMTSRVVAPKIGIYTRNESGTRVVQVVSPHSPAEDSGIKPGDRIIAIGGQNAQGPNWLVGQMNIAVEEPVTLEVERGGRRESFTFTAGRSSWSDMSSYDQVQFVVTGLGSLIMLGCAFLLLFSVPHSGRVLAGALLLASLTTVNATSLTGFAGVWRALPLFVQAIMWIPVLAEGISPALLLTFCATFWQQIIRSPRGWIVVWTPALVVLFLFVRLMYFAVYDPAHAVGKLTPASLRFILAIGIVYVVTGVVMMALSYRRLDAVKRRAARPLVYGTGAAMLASPFQMIVQSVPVPAIHRVADSLAFGTFIHIIIYWVFPVMLFHSIHATDHTD